MQSVVVVSEEMCRADVCAAKCLAGSAFAADHDQLSALCSSQVVMNVWHTVRHSELVYQLSLGTVLLTASRQSLPLS